MGGSTGGTTTSVTTTSGTTGTTTSGTTGTTTSGTTGTTTSGTTGTTTSVTTTSDTTSSTTTPTETTTSISTMTLGASMVYVAAQDGKIHVLALDKPSGTLSPVQDIDAGVTPSFLAFSADKKNLYSVDQSQDTIRSYSIDGVTGELTSLGSAPSGGSQPTHVAVEATGKYVFVANMGSGGVRMIITAVGGGFGAGVKDISTGGLAHQVVFDATNKFAFVPNLGGGTVSQLVVDTGAFNVTYNSPSSVSLPAGAGPRHMALHPTAPYAYVIRETDDSVTVFPLNAPQGTLGASIQTISTLPAGVDGGSNSAANVAFDPSGKHLYGSNRGHNSIVIYDVDPQTGMLTLVGHQPAGGSTPRHFAIDPSGQILVVGNQGSNEVRTFAIDPAAGTLTPLSTLSLPGAPWCVGAISL